MEQIGVIMNATILQNIARTYGYDGKLAGKNFAAQKKTLKEYVEKVFLRVIQYEEQHSNSVKPEGQLNEHCERRVLSDVLIMFQLECFNRCHRELEEVQDWLHEARGIRAL